MLCLAVLQLLHVLLVQGEALKVRKLRRIAESLDCKIAGELTQRLDVRGKLEVALGSRLHVHRSEDVHLIRGGRLDALGQRLSRADRSYLLLIQSSEVAEDLIWLARGVCLGRNSKQQQY